jgi:hypothetical protein
MAITVTQGTLAAYQLGTKLIDLENDTIKVILLRSGFVFDKTKHKQLINIRTNTGAVEFTVSDANNTFTRGGGSFITDGFVVGNKITTNSAEAANQGPFLVSAVSALVLTVTTMAGGNPTLTVQTATFTISSDDEIATGNGYTQFTLNLGVVTGVTDTLGGYFTYPTITWTVSGGNLPAACAAMLIDDTVAGDTVLQCIEFGEDKTGIDGTTFDIGAGSFRIGA